MTDKTINGFVVENSRDGLFFARLNGEDLCDFYADGHTRAICLEVIENIAKILGVPFSKTGQDPDPGDLWLKEDDEGEDAKEKLADLKAWLGQVPLL